MNKLNFKLIFTLILGVSVAISSCNKDETSPATETSYSSDDVLAESIYDDISNISDEAYEIGSLKSTDNDRVILGPCVTITLDTTVSPRELTIDFGEENCLCNDGKYRRGKIIVTFTGRYRKPGTVITTGFDAYYVNDNQVDGTKVVTNMGPNDDGHPYFDIAVTGLIHLADDAGTISWNATKTRTWIEGYTTRMIRDDVYLIEGEAEGIRPNGKTWEREILNPLRKELDCRWIVSGTVEIRPEDKPVRLLDYGDGNCDNQATILVNGETYTITLH